MSIAVIYLPEAEADIDREYTKYNGHSVGLGERFLEQLAARVRVIADNPEAYAVLDLDVRAATLRRFPHVVYYRFENAIVHVLAVLHGRRSSKHWRRRASRN